MHIGLHDADRTAFPNLALMKLSAAYKAAGHTTELYAPAGYYDKILSSKVFTFTPESAPPGSITGGWGRGNTTCLPDAIEHICPDYALYGLSHSLGFLTRGCSKSCKHCSVPQREGGIRSHATYTEFVRHDVAVFMDNNVLALDHGIEQIELLAQAGIKVDFNQGLDAQLIDDGIARRLSKLKWAAPLRLACDSPAAHKTIHRAAELLRWHNCTPRRYFCYMLVTNIEEAIETAKFLKGIYIDPFAQPYIDEAGTPPAIELRQVARWINTKALFKGQPWEEYKNERGPNRV